MFQELESALEEVKKAEAKRDTVVTDNKKQIERLQKEISDSENNVQHAKELAREHAMKIAPELQALGITVGGGRTRDR